ncbi:methyltransferase domain-containing protein [Methylocystis parvus]|uniref:Methyltransferase domain-containing protein n=1 Tax=Methylocystis parvus TaxID=134 RepID=A0A6B8M0W8_9HYPH|nr:methyltransferase domain-containing protein [Methylocystis parvus]QGM96491.1 methyltransferase domain-containing protein [Methylocystis parvus]WBJ99659.1 methyltransferase domain-containing protein [Methylocystis parvus OBBP]
MDRQKELLKHIGKEARGIEIGPYFSPLAPKREGYNCLSLDVFDTETLKRRAATDPSLPPEKVELIEPVDLVGSAVTIDRLCRAKGFDGDFDYVVSSHNFEHLPNPIAFLQACGRVLRRGGYLSMALPDKRACFDFFRSRTSLSAWIEAFFDGRERPTHAQIFDQNGLIASAEMCGRTAITFFLDEDVDRISVTPALQEAFAAWKQKRETQDASYYDVHCWVFTPSSFRLLLSDLYFLGLSPFAVEEVSETTVSEFYAHLRLAGYKTFSGEEAEAYHAARERMLRDVLCDEARAAGREIALFEHMRARYRRIGWNAPIVMARALKILLRTRKPALLRQYLAICDSVFFDADFYRQNYGVSDAATHYLLAGARLGFDPGPFFSTRQYLERNPDVAERGVNPLAHYELSGRPEGRQPALR